SDESFFEELALDRKNLDAPIQAVRNVYQTVSRDADVVHDVKLRVAWTFKNGSLRCRIIRPVAICTPVSLVCSGIGVEADDPAVPVTVCDGHFICRRIHNHVGRLTEVRLVIATGSLATMPDL